MRILIACEESQRVCEAFRIRGHEAYSADIQEPSGGHPEWHIWGDVLPVVNGFCEFDTMDGVHHRINTAWDMLIAHPPCTYLTCTANRWFDVSKYGEKALERLDRRKYAVGFFMEFVKSNCSMICIENPVGVMSTLFRKPDQIIQPYFFGDPYEKRTCIWLRGLPPLIPTNMICPEKRRVYKSGISMPPWYSNAPKNERAKTRSRTFQGIARAMAEQWG